VVQLHVVVMHCLVELAKTAVKIIYLTQVNGVLVSTPRCGCGSDYSVYKIGNFMRFITSFGLVVEFDGRSKVIVNVPPTYNNGRLTGICGNFDGIATNDATECNGRSYTGTSANFFGDTCVVTDPEGPAGGTTS
jgi:von Willebrand factor type D domain